MIGAVLPLMAGIALVSPQVDRDFVASGGAMNWRNGSATFDLFIDPDGRVADCTALYADEPERSNRACKSLVGRTVENGARGADGQPIHSLFSVGYMTGPTVANFDQRHLPMPADLVVDVQSLPGGATQRGVLVIAQIDTAGVVTACEPMYGDASFAAVACEQAKGQTFAVQRGANGAPVAYLTDLKVMFRAS